MVDKIKKSESEWKKELTAEQYHILREKGTERAFTGKYWNYKEKGKYVCAACGQSLFDSKTKYDSNCGWPSFYESENQENIEKKKDFKLIIPRTEVLCSKCGSHLGHLFNDGPKPTGKRYCINSASLKFLDKKEVKKKKK